MAFQREMSAQYTYLTTPSLKYVTLSILSTPRRSSDNSKATSKIFIFLPKYVEETGLVFLYLFKLNLTNRYVLIP